MRYFLVIFILLSWRALAAPNASFNPSSTILDLKDPNAQYVGQISYQGDDIHSYHLNISSLNKGRLSTVSGKKIVYSIKDSNGVMLIAKDYDSSIAIPLNAILVTKNLDLFSAGQNEITNIPSLIIAGDYTDTIILTFIVD
jgi:hypothetical protein